VPDEGLKGGLFGFQGERQPGHPAQQRREDKCLRERRRAAPHGHRPGHAAQLTVHFGSRFSMNARGPSFASFVLVTRSR
jgi:hypothetical protein